MSEKVGASDCDSHEWETVGIDDSRGPWLYYTCEHCLAWTAHPMAQEDRVPYEEAFKSVIDGD